MKRKAYERNRRLAGQTEQPIYKRKRMGKMSVGVNDISLDDFLAYRDVQMMGDYNMFDPNARLATGLKRNIYVGIISNYRELADKYSAEVEKHDEDRNK